MRPELDLKIVPATFEDSALFLRFMQKYFYPEEPLSRSLGRNPERLPLLGPMLSEGLSFRATNALDSSEDNTVGIILNTVRTTSDKEKFEEIVKKSEDKKFGKIVTALAVLEEESDFWNKIKVDKALDSLCIGTHTKYRGLNIGKKLLEKSLELAKSKNLEFATIECSSIYTARFAAELGYDFYYELVYDNYRNENNEIIFKVEPPHTGVKLYIKKL